MAMREFRIQLKDGTTGETIITAGGKCYVALPGLPDKATLYDKTGAALANPVTPTRGFINFLVDDSVAPTVDLYIMAPGGQFLTRAGVAPSGPNEIPVGTGSRRQLAKIPFNIADTTANVETDTGFDLPNPSMVFDRLHGCGVNVIVAEASKTISVGTLSSESGGSANGLINTSSVGTAGQVIGTNGGLFSSNAPAASDANVAKSISYTLSSGSAAAKGFILLPYVLN